MWSAIPRNWSPLALRRRCQAIVHQNVSQRYGSTWHRTSHHTTVMHSLREAGHQLNDAPEAEEILEVADWDELQTFVGNRRHKI